MVLKQIVLKQLDLRACGGKQVVTDAYIPVANILRRQGKMDCRREPLALRQTYCRAQKSRLAAAILSALRDQPNCCLSHRHLLAKGFLALGRLVDTIRLSGPDPPAAFRTFLKHRLNLGNTAGITATHKQHIRVFIERRQVLHQFDNTGLT